LCTVVWHHPTRQITLLCWTRCVDIDYISSRA
jgi:hypothetical protein